MVDQLPPRRQQPTQVSTPPLTEGVRQSGVEDSGRSLRLQSSTDDTNNRPPATRWGVSSCILGYKPPPTKVRNTTMILGAPLGLLVMIAWYLYLVIGKPTK